MAGAPKRDDQRRLRGVPRQGSGRPQPAPRDRRGLPLAVRLALALVERERRVAPRGPGRGPGPSVDRELDLPALHGPQAADPDEGLLPGCGGSRMDHSVAARQDPPAAERAASGEASLDGRDAVVAGRFGPAAPRTRTALADALLGTGHRRRRDAATRRARGQRAHPAANEVRRTRHGRVAARRGRGHYGAPQQQPRLLLVVRARSAGHSREVLEIAPPGCRARGRGTEFPSASIAGHVRGVPADRRRVHVGRMRRARAPRRAGHGVPLRALVPPPRPALPNRSRGESNWIRSCWNCSATRSRAPR